MAGRWALYLKKIDNLYIDGQVRLIRLVCLQRENFWGFFQTNGQTTNFCLHKEQKVYGLTKSPGLPFSVFRLKQQHIYTYI